MQAARRPLSLALASAGNNNAARIAMMAITTRSSIKVKAPRFQPQRQCDASCFTGLCCDGGRSQLMVIPEQIWFVRCLHARPWASGNQGSPVKPPWMSPAAHIIVSVKPELRSLYQCQGRQCRPVAGPQILEVFDLVEATQLWF